MHHTWDIEVLNDCVFTPRLSASLRRNLTYTSSIVFLQLMKRSKFSLTFKPESMVHRLNTLLSLNILECACHILGLDAIHIAQTIKQEWVIYKIPRMSAQYCTVTVASGSILCAICTTTQFVKPYMSRIPHQLLQLPSPFGELSFQCLHPIFQITERGILQNYTILS